MTRVGERQTLSNSAHAFQLPMGVSTQNHKTNRYLLDYQEEVAVSSYLQSCNNNFIHLYEQSVKKSSSDRTKLRGDDRSNRQTIQVGYGA